MSDIRSVKNSTQGAADQYVEQLRQKIGTDFTQQKIAGKKNRNELGKDDFIRLMSAQLKHQDPTSPLKNEQMAAQLAQFSALEQMMNVNNTLDKLVSAQKPQEQVLAASLIGKKIITDSSRFNLDKGAQPEIKFQLPVDAETVNVAIIDSKGETIRDFELGSMKQGEQSVRWDGKNSKSQEQPVGEYSYRVTGQDSEGKPLQIKTSTAGLVTGVVFEAGKPMLLVEDKKIALELVGRIEADLPAPAAKAEASTSVPASSTKAEKADGDKAVNSLAAPAKKAGPEKITQPAKNNLQDELSEEKIKSMLSALGATSMDGSEIQSEEGLNGGQGAMPLWNPTNL